MESSYIPTPGSLQFGGYPPHRWRRNRHEFGSRDASSDDDDKWDDKSMKWLSNINSDNNNKNNTSESASKYKNVHLWLPTKKLFDEFDDEYINKNTNNVVNNIILSLYGDYKTFIYHQLNKQNEKQLIDTFEILKKEKIKYDETYNSNNNNNNCNTNNNNNFNRLSITSITNICAYLSKDDINSFKLVSTSLAIQCLLEMRKYEDIGIFNMFYCDGNDASDGLIKYYKYKYLSFLQTFKSVDDLFTFDRYNGSLRYNQSLLVEKWSNKYQIPSKNILFLHFKKLKKAKKFPFKNSKNTGLITNLLRHSQIISFNEFDKEFIFDSDHKHFLVFFDMKFILNIPNEIHTNYCNYSLILLNYFDLKQQHIQYIRTLCVNKNLNFGDLQIFIENNIKILLKSILNEANFKEIENQKTIKLFAGEFYRNIKSSPIKKNQIIIFHINDNKYIEKHRLFYENVLNEAFYINPHRLNSDILKRLQLKPINKDKPFASSILLNIYSFLNVFDIPSFCLLSTSISIICIKEIRKNKRELTAIKNIFNALNKEKKIDINDVSNNIQLLLRHGIMNKLLKICQNWRNVSNLDFIANVSHVLLIFVKNNNEKQIEWEYIAKILESYSYLLNDMNINYIKNDVYSYFGQTICHLTDNDESHSHVLQTMSQFGLVQKLVNLLHGNNISLILRCIDNIACGSDEDVAHILNCNVLTLLSRILSSNGELKLNINIQKSICFIISNITASFDYKQIDLVINADIFPSLVDLLKCAEFELASEALWCIANATLPLHYKQIRYLVTLNVIQSTFVFIKKINQRHNPIMDDRNKLLLVCLELLENILISAKQNGKINDLNQFVEEIKVCGGWQVLESMGDYYYISADSKQKISYLLQTFWNSAINQ